MRQQACGRRDRAGGVMDMVSSEGWPVSCCEKALVGSIPEGMVVNGRQWRFFSLERIGDEAR